MATPFPMEIWLVFGVLRSAFSSDHEQKHEHPPSRNATARQASMGICTTMVTAPNQSTLNNQPSIFFSKWSGHFAASGLLTPSRVVRSFRSNAD
ncbi:MAG TPA: hypothetical protein VNV64_02260 [Candidatus Binatia bacterium]|nr:hypothetical protein [Candidatus Binatia bacterium]